MAQKMILGCWGSDGGIGAHRMDFGCSLRVSGGMRDDGSGRGLGDGGGGLLTLALIGRLSVLKRMLRHGSGLGYLYTYT